MENKQSRMYRYEESNEGVYHTPNTLDSEANWRIFRLDLGVVWMNTISYTQIHMKDELESIEIIDWYQK